MIIQLKTLSMKPNILIITTDQQSHNMMSCAGNPWLKTPAMDRLAAMGTRAERAYCSNPVCTPSRYSWWTGRMPSSIGVRKNGSPLKELPPEIGSGGLGHQLRKAGYETFFGGKAHTPANLSVSSLGFHYYQNNERDLLAIDTAELIRTRSSQPWCIAANFINPHDICYQAIRAFGKSGAEKGLFERAKIEITELDKALKIPEGMDEETFYDKHCPHLPDNHDVQENEPKAIDDLINQRKFRIEARNNWSEKEWRLHRWAYHRLTERVDRQIAVVVDALECSGQMDNTVIIFTSDHGDHSASHRLEHKTVFYEEAARVPLIVVDPTQKNKGVVNQNTISNVGLDLMTTCCDYAGIETLDEHKGNSLRNLCEDNADPESGAYGESQIGTMWVSKTHKYCHYDQCGSEEVLYDLVTDPGETRDCSQDPDKEHILAQHRQAHDRAKEEHRGLRIKEIVELEKELV